MIDFFEKNIEFFGEKVHKKLNELSFTIVGSGGTGNPVLTMLIGLGAKKIRVIDGDVVSASNLNRQFLYGADDIECSKAELSRDIVRRKGFNIDICCIKAYIDEDNIENCISKSDVVFDCVDNFKATFLLNDYCKDNNIIFVHSGVNGNNGQVYLVHGKKHKCLRHFFKNIPVEEKNVNIITNAMAVATYQVNEFLKYIIEGESSGMIFLEFIPEFRIRVIKV